MDYHALVHQHLSEALEQLAREVARKDGDPVDLMRTLVLVLREATRFYVKTLDAWDAAGADPELAAVIGGTTLFTPEQVRRWLAGESARQIVGGEPGA